MREEKPVTIVIATKFIMLFFSVATGTLKLSTPTGAPISSPTDVWIYIVIAIITVIAVTVSLILLLLVMKRCCYTSKKLGYVQ